jgi:hypothetical protein
MTAAVFGVSFLTPLDALAVLVVALPLAALVVSERAAARVRRTLALPPSGRLRIVPAAVALVVLVGLVSAAAAQPVVVRDHLVSQRADAQAFFVFDTSLSMQASAGPGQPTRLARAKALALRLRAALPDLPVGIVSMTDRALPDLMPTTDEALFDRTVLQSVAVDSPPPSQIYRGRATTFAALVPLANSNVFSSAASRRLLVVFTDGEAQPISPVLGETFERSVTPVFVHMWAADELLYDRDGGRKPDPGYSPDPRSGAALEDVARLTGGAAFSEHQLSQIERASRAAVGYAGPKEHLDSYARVALAPWFVLGGIVPLGFLLYRRNF